VTSTSHRHEANGGAHVVALPFQQRSQQGTPGQHYSGHESPSSLSYEGEQGNKKGKQTIKASNISHA
jgi:hypothetical protein